MNRRTIDPLSLSRRSYVPYTHVRRPQRVADRQLMFGRIQPANDNAHGGAFGIVMMLAIAAAIGAMLAIGGVL
jgi:hypothetical protein